MAIHAISPTIEHIIIHAIEDHKEHTIAHSWVHKWVY